MIEYIRRLGLELIAMRSKHIEITIDCILDKVYEYESLVVVLGQIGEMYH